MSPLTAGFMVHEPMAATVNPTLLPAASSSQAPDTTAYNALDVPSLAAGSTYADPISGVTVYKLTSASFPVASGPACAHDYAEGGDEVSLPWSGNKRTIHTQRLGAPFDHYLFDFEPGVGVSNARLLEGTMAPERDLCFTFSNNPATPYYCYIYSGTSIRRFDFRDSSEVTGGGWPKSDSLMFGWLHQSKNDGQFVWWRQSTTTAVWFEPGTNTTRTYQNTAADEPRLERNGRYVGLSLNTPANGLECYDFVNQSVVWTHDGDSSDTALPFAHVCSLLDLWVAENWNTGNPHNYGYFRPSVSNSDTNLTGGANGDPVHGNGNWIQSSASLFDQWCLFSHYGSLDPGASFLGRGAIVLLQPKDSETRRYLAHPYNTSAVYERLPFAKFSSDGKFVLFTSNMNGQTRCDLFLAQVPTS